MDRSNRNGCALLLVLAIGLPACRQISYVPPNAKDSSSTSGSASLSGCNFDGQALPHSQSVTAFQALSVPFGQVCSQQVRTCTDGTLSGSYAFASCSVAAASSCALNGLNISNGQSVTTYQASTVAYGQACVSQVRTCNNGVLSGTYSAPTCTVLPATDCSFNGQSVANGQSVTAYQASSVPFGQICSSQTRVCSNGTLSGSFAFSSCSVAAAPASCTFNGQTIASGQSVTAYQASSVAYGQTCSSQVRTCNDGTLSGTYMFPSCTISGAASCTFNGQSVAHLQSVTAYQAEWVQAGQTCSSQSRVCSNGTLSGTYTAATCSSCESLATTLNPGDEGTYWEASEKAPVSRYKSAITEDGWYVLRASAGRLPQGAQRLTIQLNNPALTAYTVQLNLNDVRHSTVSVSGPSVRSFDIAIPAGLDLKIGLRFTGATLTNPITIGAVNIYADNPLCPL